MGRMGRMSLRKEANSSTDLTTVISKYHQIIAMDNLRARPFSRLDLRGTKIGDASREFCPFKVANAQHIPGVEFSFATRHAGRQQTFSFLAQRRFRAVIHEKRSFWMMKKSDPALPPLQTRRLRHKNRSLLFALDDPRQHAFLLPGRND